MIYVTGDTHGNQYKWVEQIEPALSPGDTLAVAGDFGVGFWNGRYWSEETFFDYISEQAYTVLFIDGNHEDFVKLNGYPVEQWNGGRVHRIRRNLIHLMRGEVYELDGLTLFAFGGGNSIDKHLRQENISWWAQEMPTEAEYRNARDNLQRVCNQVDIVLTHTAPFETVQYLSTMKEFGIHGDVADERPLTAFLDEIQRTVRYRRWYFGHFHVDAQLWRDQTTLVSTVRELESGNIVRKWKPYEGRFGA